MTDRVEVRIAGLSELDEALAQFSDRIAKKAVNSALTYALTPMVKEAKAKASVAEKTHKMLYGRYSSQSYVQVQPGLLKQAIKKRRLKKSELTKLGASAGVAIHVGKSNKQKLYPKYWTFIEYGTVKMVAIPFLRPAFDATVRVSLDRFYDKLAVNITKEQAAEILDND